MKSLGLNLPTFLSLRRSRSVLVFSGTVPAASIVGTAPGSRRLKCGIFPHESPILMSTLLTKSVGLKWMEHKVGWFEVME